jgi:DNA-binding response OmpR family regulator
MAPNVWWAQHPCHQAPSPSRSRPPSALLPEVDAGGISRCEAVAVLPDIALRPTNDPSRWCSASAPGPESAEPPSAGVSGQPTRVLVVDDEPPILDLVAGYLAREGWDVRTASDGPGALDAIRAWGPDAVVLDLMLPGVDGLDVCEQLRVFSDAYVLMLTARSEEIDRIVGLTVGADDYLAKPFSPRELVARLKALLRRPRARASAPPSATAEGLDVDEGRRLVRVDGAAIELTALEFDILAVLAREPGFVVPRSRMFGLVWGEGFVADDHLVDVHIAKIRRRLGDDPANPRFVETVRGVGYRVREATG